MRKTIKGLCEKLTKDIKWAIRKHYFSEKKIKIVLGGHRCEDSIADLYRREEITQGLYYKWLKDFMPAGKRWLAGDTSLAADADEVNELCREAKDLKEVVAEQTFELRLLKKACTTLGATTNEISCVRRSTVGMIGICSGESLDCKINLSS